MSRKEWQKVKEIFEDALELGKDERKVYLDEACAGNDDLRRSVENLLYSFNDTGAVSEIGGEDHSPPGSAAMVEPGEQIGRFRIIKNLATGGMGEVYLAKDTRLDRKVAIKFLRKEFSEAIDPLHRFEREAKSASALNHPNIITIYEVGTWENADFIAMEFVDGLSVRQILNEKDITLNKALNIAIQVASALSAAHAAGIIHRDIKPENLMLRPDGLTKVLDFGLAKQTIEAPEREEVDSDAVTRRANSTIPGMIMGTVAYMSPEQARGRKTDARTDIWSLGVVLYEMLTGQTPFSGETKSDLLVGILKGEPELLSETGSEPIHELNNVLKKALTKDKDERYQNVKDLLLDLKIIQNELSSGDHKTEILRLTTREEAAMTTDATEPAKSVALAPARNSLWPLIPVAVLVAIFGFWYLWQRRPPDVTPLSSLSTSQVTSWKSEPGDNVSSDPRMSPDGKLIAFVANKNGRSSIWIKQIGGGDAFTRKQDDSSDMSPVWSPDGEKIAYYSDRSGMKGIWAFPALGGAPKLLSAIDPKAINTSARLIQWRKDSPIIFFEANQNLYSLNVETAQSSRVTNFDETRFMDYGFSISPDGHHIAYTSASDGQRDIWVADLNGQYPKRITNDAAADGNPLWLPDGNRIIYNSKRDGVQQICLAYTDGRAPQQITLNDSDITLSDISSDGSKILYFSTKDDSDLWSIGTSGGRETQITSDIGVEFWPDASPDGNSLAYQAIKRISVSGQTLSSGAYIRQLSGDGATTEIAENAFDLKWAPDGKKIAFLRSQPTGSSLWMVSPGGGDPRALTKDNVLFGGYFELPYTRSQTQDYQWSPDSRSIVFSAIRDGVSNIWEINVDTQEQTQLTSNTNEKNLYFNPTFSRDGKTVAWMSRDASEPKSVSWNVWCLENGKSVQVFNSEDQLRLLGWSESGRELIVKSIVGFRGESVRPAAEVKITAISTTGAEPRVLQTIKDIYFQGMKLSPDGRIAGFVSRTNDSDEIQTLDLTDRTPKAILTSNDTRVYFSSLAFSGDGKTLFYGKQAKWQIISVIDNFK